MRSHLFHYHARLTLALVTLWLAAQGHLWSQGLQPPHKVPPKTTQQPSSTSGSGQFTVYGSDLATRSAFCLLCDDTASALGRLLRDDARYSIPVVVSLMVPPDVDRTGPAIITNIRQLTHGGFHLQINAQLRGDFQSEEFARELVRVLLAERILRNHAELKTNRDRVLPDWVLTGVTQALEFRARSRPSAMFAAVFRGGQVFSVDRILSADPALLDALSRTIYETSSCAIVLALLDQQDGPVRFGRFLNALALDNKPDRDLLKEFFPTLGASKNSLEKWWSLQMALLATPSALESMTIAQTEQKLDEALVLRYEPLPEKKGKGSKKEPVKTAEASTWGGFFPFDQLASIERPHLFFDITQVVSPLLGVSEVAAVPAKDTDSDADKKNPKKKDAAKDQPAKDAKNQGKSAKGEPEKPKKDETKPDKKSAEKKEPEKKNTAKTPPPDRKEAARQEAEKKLAEKKATEKKEAEKKLADKKATEKKEKDQKDGEKKSGEKVPELRANPHRIAQHPGSVPSPSAEEKSKEKEVPAEVAKNKEGKPGAEEENSKKHGSRWNPAHWFRKDEKPAPAETAKKEEDKPVPRPHSAPKADLKPAAPQDKDVHGTIKDYAAIWKRPDREKILDRNLNLLNALKNQAHPLYRPIVADYAEVVRNLMSGKDHGAADKLAAIHARYLKVSNEAKAVESYLDWYQASETKSYSGAFDDYLKMHDKIRKEVRPRGDAISLYLDSLEKEFEN